MEGEQGPATASAIGKELRDLLPAPSEGASNTPTGRSGTAKLPVDLDSNGVLVQRVVSDPTNENSAVQMHFQAGVESGDGSDSGAAFTGSNERMSAEEHAALDVVS